MDGGTTNTNGSLKTMGGGDRTTGTKDMVEMRRDKGKREGTKKKGGGSVKKTTQKSEGAKAKLKEKGEG